MPASDTLSARCYQTDLHRGDPPHQPPGNLAGQLGVCFSGGGSRACTAAMGQLRALHHLNLLHRDRIGCISSVSGGTWALSLYSFRSPELAIAEFLGEVVERPEDLLWNDHATADKAQVLSHLPDGNLGWVPTRLSPLGIIKTVIELHHRYRCPPQQLWQRAMDALVFTPFGLGTNGGTSERFIGYHPQWLQQHVLPHNRDRLTLDDFQPLADDPLRPYLIMNTTLMPRPEQLLPFEIGAAMAGAAATQRLDEAIYGGGYADTFTVGTDSTQPQPPHRLTTPEPLRRLAIADAAGLSSAFYAALLADKIIKAEGDIEKLEQGKELHWLRHEFQALSADIDGLDDLVPELPYWPAAGCSEATQQATPLKFADGGSLENIGIMPLLNRQCSRIVAFVNTPTPLTETAGQLTIDSALPPLFGYCPRQGTADYRRYGDMSEAEFAALPDTAQVLAGNQVFPEAAFPDLLVQLKTASQGGTAHLGTAPVVVKQTLSTIDNRLFGVAAGHSVSVVWVYNNPASEWQHRLSGEVRTMMALNHGEYHDFPNYATVSKIHLNSRQVNLLAHFACWQVLAHAPLFTSL